jgi:hypothetical protein
MRPGRSKFVLLAAALLVICGAGALVLHGKAGAEGLPRAAGGGRHDAGQPAGSRAKHSVAFGVSDPELIHLTAKAQLATLTRMRSIGISAIRFDANWDWVQFAGPHSYDWTMLDREVHSAVTAHLKVDLVIDGCPPWAEPAGSSHDSAPAPASAVQFSGWAVAVASRYAREGVRDFEIWNEPNDTKFWQPKVNPAFYTKMLADSYRAIKKADPSAFVITGGLAPVTSNHGSLSATAFLAAMYARGAKPYFDAVAVHPYSFPALPGTYEPWSAWSQMSQTSPSVRGVMKRYHDSAKPIWITEFGAPSDGPAGVGANGEAAELRAAISIAKSTSWISALFVYTWQDSGASPKTNADWFGLLTNHGRVKPAYSAVAKAIR